jgi:predicted dithiol-disulfide oxidoreductase (DUF899 family)
MVEIDKEYLFRGPDGQASLPGLFEGLAADAVARNRHARLGEVWAAGR